MAKLKTDDVERTEKKELGKTVREAKKEVKAYLQSHIQSTKQGKVNSDELELSVDSIKSFEGDVPGARPP